MWRFRRRNLEGTLNGGFRRKKFRIKPTAEEDIYDVPYSGENICKVAYMYVSGGKSLQNKSVLRLSEE